MTPLSGSFLETFWDDHQVILDNQFMFPVRIVDLLPGAGRIFSINCFWKTASMSCLHWICFQREVLGEIGFVIVEGKCFLSEVFFSESESAECVSNCIGLTLDMCELGPNSSTMRRHCMTQSVLKVLPTRCRQRLQFGGQGDCSCAPSVIFDGQELMLGCCMAALS